MSEKIVFNRVEIEAVALGLKELKKQLQALEDENAELKGKLEEKEQQFAFECGVVAEKDKLLAENKVRIERMDSVLGRLESLLNEVGG